MFLVLFLFLYIIPAVGCLYILSYESFLGEMLSWQYVLIISFIPVFNLIVLNNVYTYSSVFAYQKYAALLEGLAAKKAQKINKEPEEEQDINK